ncbi:MAG: T9SS type A sorting domain-containing protein, partial [Ignavibacteriales bacterium]|nr:T9SS type A sorting domain-containing protein [Ignavibacteriales bacterium]
GNDTDATRQAEFNESGETDFLGRRRMSWIFSVNNQTTFWNIKNNYYVVSDSGAAFYARHAAAGVTGEGSPLSWHINSRIGADSVNAFKKVALQLSNIPKLMTAMMDWYRRPIVEGGAGKTKSTSNFSRLLYDYDRRGIFYYSDTLNCPYPTSNAAYTAAEGGFPVGDLNWFPAKKAEWIPWYAINAVAPAHQGPVGFELLQNYPNPFNPSTKIAFTLKNQSNVTVSVFNALGEKVATVVNGELATGYHEFDFNASALASGLYIYRLEAGNFSQVRKMMVLK